MGADVRCAVPPGGGISSKDFYLYGKTSIQAAARFLTIQPVETFGGFDNRVAPALTDTLSKTLIPQSFRDEPPRRPERALHQAGVEGVVDSDHPGYVQKTSFYTRASLHPAFGIAVAALLTAEVSALISGGKYPREEKLALTRVASSTSQTAPNGICGPPLPSARR